MQIRKEQEKMNADYYGYFKYISRKSKWSHGLLKSSLKNQLTCISIEFVKKRQSRNQHLKLKQLHLLLLRNYPLQSLLIALVNKR